MDFVTLWTEIPLKEQNYKAVMQELISVLILITFAENVSLLLWQLAVITQTVSADILLMINVFVFPLSLSTESRLSPSGWPVQAAGLGGAKGPALVQTPQEPR